MDQVRVGCCGWGYDDWKGVFYSADAAPIDYLTQYSRVFDLVEVDASFYRCPSPFLVKRWNSATPNGFTFSLKIPRAVTHDSGAIGPPLDEFLGAIEPLRSAGKLGPVVAQFPPSFKRTEAGVERLNTVLNGVPASDDLAVELRHKSWWVDATRTALAQRKAALVWSVYPGVDVPPWATGSFGYARFVGDRALTTFSKVQRDDRPAIEAVRKKFDDVGREMRTHYLLVNNHFMGFGPGTVQVVREVFGLDPLDLGAAARAPGAPSLEAFDSRPH